MTTGFTPEVEDVLRAAGWSPDRRTDVAAWTTLFEVDGVHAHQAALGFLGEFGGLDVAISGPGVSRAREPFTLDPAQCAGEGDRYAEFGEEIGRELFPIGVLAHGALFLAIDENSEIYVLETWIGSFGPMPEGMENLIRGVQATRLD